MNLPLVGLARIMHQAFAGDDLSNLIGQLNERLARDPADAAAMLDMSTILQIRGQSEIALQLQWQALALRQHYTLMHQPPAPAVKLLAIMGRGEIMANTPVEFLVEDSDVALELLYLGTGLPVPEQIPEHDVAMVAVCESERNRWLLDRLQEVMHHWPRPFINSPAGISRQRRDGLCAMTQNIEGVIPSSAERMAREELEGLEHFADYPSDLFPIIVRPLGSHAGSGLEKLEQATDVVDYLQAHSDEEFYVAPFIDYRSADGKYRKYRVVVVGGEPMAAHMAVSSRWMVHYLNADMLASAEHRAEEAEFMLTFEKEFAVRHRRALANIDRRMGLDYYSIDCAEMRSGELVVFEVDSGAVVHSMDPVDKFPYKAPQMRKVFGAFRNLLVARGQNQRSAA